MKKLFKKKPSSKSRTSVVKNGLRFNPIIALIIVVLVGGAGVWMLRGSSASGGVTLQVQAVRTNTADPNAPVAGNLAGVQVSMYPTHPYCSGSPGSGASATTGANGYYNYGVCSNNEFCIDEDSINGIPGYSYYGYRIFASQAATQQGALCAYVPDNTTVTFQLRFVAAQSTINLNASPASIVKGSSTTLSWSVPPLRPTMLLYERERWRQSRQQGWICLCLTHKNYHVHVKLHKQRYIS